MNLSSKPGPCFQQLLSSSSVQRRNLCFKWNSAECLLIWKRNMKHGGPNPGEFCPFFHVQILVLHTDHKTSLHGHLEVEKQARSLHLLCSLSLLTVGGKNCWKRRGQDFSLAPHPNLFPALVYRAVWRERCNLPPCTRSSP